MVQVLVSSSAAIVDEFPSLQFLVHHHSSGTQVSNISIKTVPYYLHIWAFSYDGAFQTVNTFIPLHAICQETLYGERLTVFLIWKYCRPQTEGSFLVKNTMKLMTHICCSLVVLVCSQGMNGFRQTPQNSLQSCKTKYQMECLRLNACVSKAISGLCVYSRRISVAGWKPFNQFGCVLLLLPLVSEEVWT